MAECGEVVEEVRCFDAGGGGEAEVFAGGGVEHVVRGGKGREGAAGGRGGECWGEGGVEEEVVERAAADLLCGEASEGVRVGDEEGE